MSLPEFRLVIAGGGPGGLAPLLAAHRTGRLDAMLAEGVAIVEMSDSLGAGAIGGYAIRSDSSGATFVDCLRGTRETPLTALASHPLAAEIAAAGEGPVPLERVGCFMALVGDTLGRMVAAHPKCRVLTGHKAVCVRKSARGWTTTTVDRSGRPRALSSRLVLSATGAHQPPARLEGERVAGMGLQARWGDKLLQSGDVFGQGRFAAVAGRLSHLSDPRVAIVGGSTSAAAVAHALLHRLPSVKFGEGGVSLLHRRDLHIYYPSAAEALAEGYTAFTDEDICPVSRRVFRFAGFRLDSRELVMQVRGIGGRAGETRLVLHRLAQEDPLAVAMLDRADLVVAALGYRPRALPVMDRMGAPIPLGAAAGAQAPLVDGRCRIVDADGVHIPGLFGIGLAAGFVPRGALGGEPSFSGQANGLWLWQNDVGRMIVDEVMDDAAARPFGDAVAMFPPVAVRVAMAAGVAA